MGIPLWIAKLLGKYAKGKIELKEGTVETKKWYQSRTIWQAIVLAILGISQAVGQATGHPINIPDWVYGILAGAGLYTARTGSKPIE